MFCLEFATTIANNLLSELTPFYSRAEIAGSIRRQKPWVNDIDLVLIPQNQGLLAQKLHDLGCRFGGPKYQRFTYRGIPTDIYLATTETWATLLLIRTGSPRHNVELASKAKARGWHLKANGGGLYDHQGQRVAGDTEESIFQALGLPYREPRERD